MTTRKNSIFSFITLGKIFTMNFLYNAIDFHVDIIIKIFYLKKILYNYFTLEMFFKIYFNI